MRLFSLIFYFIFIQIAVFGQRNNLFNLDSVFIYQGFYSGGTTADLNWNSIAVDTMKRITKIKMEKIDVDSLNLLIESVNKKKHHQQKVGPSYYAAFYSEGKLHRVSVIPHCCLIDLTVKREYRFRNTDYMKIFDRIIEKNYRKQ